MESSWSYDCGEKGFMLSNQTVTPSDFLNGRTQSGFTNWGLMKGPYSYDVNTMLLSSDQNGLENQGNLEVGFIRKQSSHDSLRNCLSSNGSGGGDVINMQTIASNAVSGDEESSSRLSNSGNSRDSSLIDLKLGRFGDNFNATIRMSCSDSPTPAKRVKACSLNSQAAFCQVYGCNKDLSSSKDYHKRQKVCDVHSKTAKVVVNGLEQRFCQQCSRFHLLGEFDDGKRSCRRRLAGHNERRRKPQAGRAARLLHAYNGSTSFICHDTLPTHTAPQKCNCPTPYGSIMKQCPSLNTSTMTPSELPACALSLLSSQPQSSNPFPHHNGDFFNGSADLSTDVGSAFNRGFFNGSADLSTDVGSAFNRGFFNGSEYVNLKDDDGATVDLLQLSSQLQRVEHQRQAVSVKQEDQTFCCL